MKIIVISFVLKLYVKVYIFKYIKEICGQKIINLARKIVKQLVKIAKVKRGIRFFIALQKNNLTAIFTRSNMESIITYKIRYRIVKNIINIFSSNTLTSEEEYAISLSSDEHTLKKNYTDKTRTIARTKDKDKKNM